MSSDDLNKAAMSLRMHTELERIAEQLGCSIDEFTDSARGPLYISGASELLTIWVELDDHIHRERLLEFARQLAASV